MADVSGDTLLMAIQAVNDAIASLRVSLHDGSGDSRDDTEMLMSYTKTAQELRAAYEVARLTTADLPPYDELVEPGEDE
jgi:hypothetical protein